METKFKYGLLGILSVFLLTLGIFAFSGTGINPVTTSNEGIGYQGSVCVYKNGEEVDCNHNLLYDTGANMVRDTLIAPSDAVDYIELCNATAGCATPAADKSEAYTAYANCGLTTAQGTTTPLGQTGNWTVTHTFTASCDNLEVNATRLQNSTGDDLAGNTFSLVTLQNNDQLTINWTIQVS